MGPYALSLIIVSLMDQPVQMVEVFTFPKKRSVYLSQTSVPRRYYLQMKDMYGHYPSTDTPMSLCRSSGLDTTTEQSM